MRHDEIRFADGVNQCTHSHRSDFSIELALPTRLPAGAISRMNPMAPAQWRSVVSGTTLKTWSQRNVALETYLLGSCAVLRERDGSH